MKRDLIGSLSGSALGIVGAALVVVLGVGLGVVVARSAPGNEDEQRRIEFDDVRRQTREFIGYNESIRLTTEQEAVKRAALSELRAPCCADFSLYTCCCPCNLAKSSWGLSHLLIAERDYGPAEVREKVAEWLTFINPDGFSGDVCFTGGCNRPFKHNGCGGMEEATVVW